MILKTDGIVLKQFDMGEDKKILTLLSRSLGKIQVVTRNLKSVKGKSSIALRPFSYSEFLLFKGKGDLYQLNQSDIKSSFFKISEDLEKLMACSYLLELTCELLPPEDPNSKIFDLLLKTLKMFENRKKGYDTLIKAYEIKALQKSGYMPQLGACVVCGRADLQEAKFSISGGGLVCGACAAGNRSLAEISQMEIEVISYICEHPIESLEKLKINAAVLAHLDGIFKAYIKEHVTQVHFKSLDLLKNI